MFMYLCCALFCVGPTRMRTMFANNTPYEIKSFLAVFENCPSVSVVSRTVSVNWFTVFGLPTPKLQEPYRERLTLGHISQL